MTKLLALILFTPVLAFAQLKEEGSFGNNPGNLKMLSFVSEVSKKEKRPLVVALHGCTQSANSMAIQSGWNTLAQKNQFIVVYPQQKRSNNGNKCFNWFKEKDANGHDGELESIKSMIGFAVENYNADTSQIFVYGLSAGAAMGVSLMANYPNLFKAGASFAGAPHKIVENYSQALKAMNGKVDKTPKEWGELMPLQNDGVNYPKLIVFHGDKDQVVDKKNAQELIEQWSFVHNIDTIIDEVKRNFESNNRVIRMSYTNQNQDEKVVYYKIEGLGHALPVGPGLDEKQGGSAGIYAKDVDFFSTFYVAKDFGLIKPQTP